jgi:hypothetical protein
MDKQIEPAEFKLGLGGHTSAAQLAVTYLRGHNKGHEVLKVPTFVIRELIACDGQHGPTEIKITADLEATGILATRGTDVIFWAGCLHSGNFPKASDCWRIVFENGRMLPVEK